MVGSPSNAASPVAVEFQSISKNFGEHPVLNKVSFQAFQGEVLALMGENGAGKSTLMRILAGVYPTETYSGHFSIHGKLCKFSGVPAARACGIAMIHQELGLFPDLSVAENLLLEELSRQNWALGLHISWKEVFNKAQGFLDELGFSVDARALISELATGKRQLVEIARALRTNATVLVFDEPTSALTENEVQKLFEILKKLKSQQKTVFYVSHRMEEIYKTADRVVVLRDGSVAGVDKIQNINTNHIINWMVGREVSNVYPRRKVVEGFEQSTVLKASQLNLLKEKKVILKNISFEVKKGEIFGIGGLMGSGRSELALTLFGFFGKKSPYSRNMHVSGKIFFEGSELSRPGKATKYPERKRDVDVTKYPERKRDVDATKYNETLWESPHQALLSKVALLTEDRKNTGLFLNRPAYENMTVTVLKKLVYKKSNWIKKNHEKQLVAGLAKDLKIHGPGLDVEVGLYSGGNQQKVALSKCLAIKPRLLILDEPTRGVDIGAKLEIYEILQELTKNGVSILLISSEMPELLGMSDRVLVLRQGEVSQIFEKSKNQDFHPEEIMRAASL